MTQTLCYRGVPYTRKPIIPSNGCVLLTYRGQQVPVPVPEPVASR